MMKITKFLLIICFVHIVSCKKEVAILINKQAEDCSTSKSTVGIPIKSTLLPINEFTFCGKYRFKILKDVVLMYMNSPEVYIRIMDFDEKVGLVKHELITYFFFFPNQTVNPDSWQNVCLSVSNVSIKLVLNGELFMMLHQMQLRRIFRRHIYGWVEKTCPNLYTGDLKAS